MVPPEFLAGAHLQSLGSADTCDAVHGYHYCWVAPKILPTSKYVVCPHFLLTCPPSSGQVHCSGSLERGAT